MKSGLTSCSHAVEPPDTSVFCTCLQSPFLLNLLLMFFFFLFPLLRFRNRFFRFHKVHSTFLNVHLLLFRNVSSENMFCLPQWRFEVLLKTSVIMEKSWWLGVLWQLLGQTYWRKARELSSVLRKKLKIAFMFFCRAGSELKLHITDETHGMRFDV